MPGRGITPFFMDDLFQTRSFSFIGISAFVGLISFLKTLTKSTKEHRKDKETIRLRLARDMLLALDLEVGIAILQTVLVPSLNELSILAVVVDKRIVLRWSQSKGIE